jgi:hypothetical protein
MSCNNNCDQGRTCDCWEPMTPLEHLRAAIMLVAICALVGFALGALW